MEGNGDICTTLNNKKKIKEKKDFKENVMRNCLAKKKLDNLDEIDKFLERHKLPKSSTEL